MENRRRSKRIEKQSDSSTNEEHKTDNKFARQVRADIAKMDEQLSARITSIERKFDGIGRVVFGGKTKIQKLVEDVEVIRSDNDANADMLCDLALSQDRSDSLCNVILKMHDTLKTFAEAQGIPLEAIQSTSPTEQRIVGNNHAAMEDHVKKMERRLQKYKRTCGMSIKTYAHKMKTLHQEICNHGGDSSKQFLKTNFINGLGRPFEDIFMKLLHGNLPSEWQPMDIDDLVPVAENYLNEKPSSSSRKRKYSDDDDDSD